MNPSTLQARLLTPPGRSAIATIEVRGPDVAGRVAALFQAASRRCLADAAIDRIQFGLWQCQDDAGEELVVCRTAACALEIHCHGGYAAVAAIARSLQQIGCRWMENETCSASIESAAWQLLPNAVTRTTAAILLDQTRGALRRELQDILQGVDQHRGTEVTQRLNGLATTYRRGQHLIHPWQVVWLGAANVGKSSLMNALLGYPRAITHDQPGTTRDVVTADAVIGGWPVQLHDVAGIRATENPLEQAGIERAMRQAESADLVVLVLDASRSLYPIERRLMERFSQALRVANKSDLLIADRPTFGLPEPPHPLSALTGLGLDQFQQLLLKRLLPASLPGSQAVLFTPEQYDGVQTALQLVRAGEFSPARDCLQALLAIKTREPGGG